MNSTMKKGLSTLLLVTAFNTTSAFAVDTKQHIFKKSVEQCVIGEHTETKKPTNKKQQKTNTVNATESLKTHVDTQTLLSSIDEKISAELDSSMSKINTEIDENLSKVTSSITAYFSNILSN